MCRSRFGVHVKYHCHSFQPLTDEQSNCEKMQYYEILYMKVGSSTTSEWMKTLATRDMSAKNVTEDVEFDAEYWFVIVAHNNQPLDSSSMRMMVKTPTARTYPSHYVIPSFARRLWAVMRLGGRR